MTGVGAPLPSENVTHALESNNNNDKNNHNNNSNNLKRKAFDRLAESNSKQSGRGSLVGWTSCPLCGRYSTKQFALGRGISSHLYAVHTPWNPGKVERKKRRRLEEERQRNNNIILQKQLRQQQENANEEKPNSCNNTRPDDNQHFIEFQSWQPTPQEVEAWDAKVLEIVKELEAKAAADKSAHVDSCTKDESPLGVVTGLERNGQPCKKYRESLPPFLQAAADGDSRQLETMINEAKSNGNVMRLLETRDRHLSTADHWAAGGGHVECLKCLLQARQDNETSQPEGKSSVPQKRIRRRDGKTCLHYAARYGQLECVKYLLDTGHYNVDEVSGDGTTPLHLACFGLHVPVVQYLIESGADVKAANEWGCLAAHWTAMASTTTTTSSTSFPTLIREMANLLKEHGVSFVERQRQGHSAMHKAAQRQNRPLLEWLAQSSDQGGAGLTKEELQAGASKDDGGHTPSSIWRSVGGDLTFAIWMKERGW